MTARISVGVSLKEACLQEALAIIESVGLDQLSLREIARRLGVSHQAPYKHFPSRDHVLAELVRRAFDAFAQHLDAHPLTDNASAEMHDMGAAYIAYALAHPMQYRLMFGTPLPPPEKHPEMMHSAQHAFGLLRDCLIRMEKNGQYQILNSIDADALFIWSCLHGLATILASQVLATLSLTDEVIKSSVENALYRIGIGIHHNPNQP